MPIVFEAPQPFSASIAAGYGAAEQQSRDLPTIVGAQLQGAQIAAHANQAAADNQYRGAAALGQQRVQASEAEAQREAQARDFDLRRQIATEQANNQRFSQSLQLAEYQRAPEMQQRQFELRAELANAEMTQQENLRLKQLQEYLGAIDGDNSLSPEEKADLKMQVQAKVSPLAAKKARTQMMQEQAHTEQMMQQVRLSKQAEINADQIEAQAKSQGIGTMRRYDPHSGIPNVLFRNPTTGVWYNPNDTNASAGKGKAGSEAGASGLTSEQYLKHRQELQKDVDHLVLENMKLPPELRNPNLTWDNSAQLLADRLTGAGLAPDVGRHAAAGRDGGDAAGGGQPPAERPDPVKALDPAIEEAKGRNDLLPGAKQQLVGAMEALKQIVAAYPDIRTAPPELQAKAQAAARVIAAATPPRPARTSEQSSRQLGGAASNIPTNPPPPPGPPSWWQRNVADNIPDLPGI